MAMAMATAILKPFFVWGVVFLMLVALHKLFVTYFWIPLRLHQALRAQGIPGLPFHAVFGNFQEFSSLMAASRASPLPHTTHNIALKLMPHILSWSAQYGRVYSFGWSKWTRLVLGDPELCKVVLNDKLGYYPKSELPRPEFLDLLADGLVVLEGKKWAQHRKMVNPAFYIKKLKGMTPTFISLAETMLETWQTKLQVAEAGQVEIDVCKEFSTLTADVIAHTAFGSSFVEGKQVFELQREQQLIIGQVLGTRNISGSRFLPTTINRHRWRLTKQINTILGRIICMRLDRMESASTTALENDLLGLMLAAFKEESEGSHETSRLTLYDIIAECKTFFFAGHDTTSTLLTWAVFLLSVHPEWQEKAREEVKTLLGSAHHPDPEALNKTKTVDMILNETLRLYPPITAILRKASKDLRLKNIFIQKGTTLLIPICCLHIDRTLWGPDALEFNPERFANGVLKACTHPMAFLPFSSGPRNCVGQNFAMIEARVALCMVLQRFRFHLSPGYKHSPITFVTLQPEHGMQIIMEPC